MNINMSKILKERNEPLQTVTISISGMRWFNFRVKLGILLIRLGTWIAYSKTEIVKE